MTTTIAVPPRRRLFGLELDPLTMPQVLHRCDDALEARDLLLVGVVNAAKVVHLHKDPVLRDSLLEANLLLADGQSVVWASRLLRQPLPERVAGIDLFEQLLRRADEHGYGIFLLGARPEVLAALVDHIEQRYPGARIAGARDGYFTPDQAAEVADEIAASRADMLFLGMVSPKKETFLAAHGDRLGVPVLHGVGGSFDVLAGVTRRAPRSWQRLGLEWAYRLKQEPGRLWRRYLVTNSVFIWFTLRELVRPTPVYRRSGGPGGTDG